MSFGDLKVQDLIYEDSSNNEITVVISDLATKNNPTFTGIVTVPTPPASDVSTKAASTAFVDSYYATKASPTFTGTPTVPGYAPLAGAAFTGAVTGTDLTLSGNLTVGGSQTIINTTVLQVEDKHIEIGKVSTPSDTTADGGGIILKASSDRTFLWVNATDAWTSSEHIHLLNTKNLILGDDSHSTLSYLHGSSTTRLINRNTYIDVLDNGTAAGSITLAVDGGNQFLINERGFIAPQLGTVGMQWAPALNQDIVLGVRGRTQSNNVAVVDLTSSQSGVGGADVKYGKIRFSWDNTPNVHDNGTAIIEGCSGAASSNTDRATALKFYTAPTGSAGSYAALPVERLRIWKDGQLGIGGANYGSSGEVLTSGGSGAAPSWAAIPAGGNTIDLVADGAIAAGKPVIIKSNGKAEQVQIATANIANAPSGTITAFLNSNTEDMALAWSSTSSKLMAIRRVSSTSGANVCFPSPILGTNTFTSIGGGHSYDTSNGYESDVCWDPDNDKFIIAWRDGGSSSAGKAVVATISSGASGDSISFGTAVTFEGGGADTYKIAYDTSNDKVVIAFRDYSDGGLVKAIVGTVSGTSISFGTAVSTGMACSTVHHTDICFDSNSNKIIICTRKSNAANNQLAVVVGTVSGTGISFGSVVEGTGSSDEVHHPKCTFDSNVNKVVFSYRLVSSGVGHAIVGTVSGTSISFGTAVAFPSNATMLGQDICFDPATNNFFVFFCRQNNSNHATLLKGAVSGTGIAWADSGGSGAYNTQTNTGYASTNDRWAITPVYPGKLAAFCAYSSGYSKLLLFSTQTGVANFSNAHKNFLGFAEDAISDGNTGTIKLEGNVVGNQSGLTAGNTYHVEDDGTLDNNWDATDVGLLALSSTTGLIRRRD